ncbi:glucose-1-phosphate thymidylyltransferase RfbA [Gammaproteobacteria bacterium]|nr:glucose-1-phosphate thymidylyltransferase RfbA [Gammaproteobacteria bacterium]
MKGIILAGGNGTRLHPMTLAVNKQLLHIYDKPMIYYPLSTLMLAGIREILIISSSEAQPSFQKLLGNGANLGLKISYGEQQQPNGIAEAFIIGEEFIDNDPCALILGDNVFHGHGLSDLLTDAAQLTSGAHIFTNWVSDPERYGVANFDKVGNIIGLTEKPEKPISNWAVVGIYFFDNRVSAIAKSVLPSGRGELEILDVIQNYLNEGTLKIKKLGRGYSWLDTGTPQSLLQASTFVQTLQHRQGLSVCCPEEVALSKGFIDLSTFKQLAQKMATSDYGKLLLQIASEFDNNFNS